MSELNSFFLRVSIDKAQLDEFLQAKPSTFVVTDNWRDWWDSREMYGDSSIDDEIGALPLPSYEEFVKAWTTDEEAFAFSEFNADANTWDFGIILCSENYDDILPLIAFCANLAPHTRPSADNFAIIYPYFWGDSELMLYLTFEDGKAEPSLANEVDEVEQEHLDCAEERLHEKWIEMQANREVD